MMPSTGRRFAVAALVAAAVATIAACQRASQPPPSSAVISWTEVVDPEGHFRLLMPAGYRQLAVPRPNGGTIHQFSAQVGSRFFDLTLTNYIGDEARRLKSPATLALALDQMQAGMMRPWKDAVVVEQSPIQLGAVSGRAVLYSTDQGRMLNFVRFYFPPDNIYMQAVRVPATDRQDPDIARFMESLRLQ